MNQPISEILAVKCVLTGVIDLLDKKVSGFSSLKLIDLLMTLDEQLEEQLIDHPSIADEVSDILHEWSVTINKNRLR